MDGFSMIGAEDARRARLLGADAKKIAINGNAKYDGLSRRINLDEARKIHRIYTPGEKEIVWVAGSTRRFEETVMLNVYQKLTGRFPHLLLIIAPRHIERSDYITEQVHKRGLKCQRRSELNKSGKKRDAPVVVVDIIGELFATYSVADLVFCGGSLAPLGGQNIMEPAIWGKPVFFGPSMDDFNDARIHLEDLGGGFMVKDEADLTESLIHFIVHPKLRKQAGDAAKAAANFHSGAAGRHARFIQALIS
jgi:3-deoxy-D-manno-octulosonic-acid transferase